MIDVAYIVLGFISWPILAYCLLLFFKDEADELGIRFICAIISLLGAVFWPICILLAGMMYFLGRVYEQRSNKVR